MSQDADGALTPLSIDIDLANGAGLDEGHVVNVLTMLGEVFDGLRSTNDVPPAESMELIVASDLVGAVQAHAGHMVGVERLDDFQAERVGGTVVGKTLFQDEAHPRIVIVLSAEVFSSSEPDARAMELYLISHEMAHGLIGQLRYLSGVAMSATYLPWETSRWIARYAFEEYVADRLADTVLHHSGYATDSEGAQHRLSKRLASPGTALLVASVRDELAKMTDRIHRYRLDGDLQGMWFEVFQATSDVIIALAHAQAEEDGADQEPSRTVTSNVASDLGPLHRCWATMHREFLSFSFPCTPEDFRRFEPSLLDAAGGSVIEFWGEVGLTFRPAGDTFHISVAPSALAWPGTDSY